MRPEIVQCDLCGTSVGEAEQEARDETFPVQEKPPAKVEGPAATSQQRVRYCPSCGKPSPLDANFCSWCGNRLKPMDAARGRVRNGRPEMADGTPGSISRGDVPTLDAGDPVKVNRRIMLSLVLAVLAVVGLFFVSVLSQNTGGRTTEIASRPADEAVSMDPATEDEVVALRNRIANAAGEQERIEARRELVAVYAKAGAFQPAAQVQKRLAEIVGGVEEWTLLGNLLFDQMERAPEGPLRQEAARASIAAYTRALEIDPSNNDVRTDRAVAYLNTSESPMKAIEEIGIVLENDPAHPQANFNRAVMLTMIGRADEALEQYHHVVDITAPGSPIHEEANRRVAQFEQRINGSTGE